MVTAPVKPPAERITCAVTVARVVGHPGPVGDQRDQRHVGCGLLRGRWSRSGLAGVGYTDNISTLVADASLSAPRGAVAAPPSTQRTWFVYINLPIEGRVWLALGFNEQPCDVEALAMTISDSCHARPAY